MKIWIENNVVKVKSEYKVSDIKNLKKIDKGKWSKIEKVWIFPIDKLEELNLLKQDKKSKLEILQNYMIQKNYSKKTIKTYSSHFKRYLQYTNDKVSIYTINKYILDVIKIKDCSSSYCNQAISAIKIYIRISGVLSEDEIIKITRSKETRKLPVVLNKEEIIRLLEVCNNQKHKTVLMLAYSSGLRVSEVANLKVKNLDSKEMIIFVQNGKGGKDRITILSKRMLLQLRKFYKIYRPNIYLFENPQKTGPISSRTLQKVFKKALKESKINKEASFHSLRHSFATHLLDNNVDIRKIQELLGHSSLKTTEIYTHVSTSSLSKIINPLDTL